MPFLEYIKGVQCFLNLFGHKPPLMNNTPYCFYEFSALQNRISFFKWIVQIDKGAVLIQGHLGGSDKTLKPSELHILSPSLLHEVNTISMIFASTTQTAVYAKWFVITTAMTIVIVTMAGIYWGFAMC